jgi:S1-C subfamily serine protease
MDVNVRLLWTNFLAVVVTSSMAWAFVSSGMNAVTAAAASGSPAMGSETGGHVEVPAALRQNILDNTAEVIVQTACSPLMNFGTAWSFAPGYLVTNAHVVTGSVTASVLTDDGTHIPADVVMYDPAEDVAILHVAVPVVEPLVLSPDTAFASHDGLASGYPHGVKSLSSVQIVSRTTMKLPSVGEHPPSRELVDRYWGDVSYGSSGGPLVNVRGEVIGMVSAMQPADSGRMMGIAVDISQIRWDLSSGLGKTSSVFHGGCAIHDAAAS